MDKEARGQQYACTLLEKAHATQTLEETCAILSPCYSFQLQQKDHYDRTQVDKEARGQQYASTLLEKALAQGPTTIGDTSQPGPSHLSQPTIASDSEEDLDTLSVGDIVTIVLPGSTLNQW